LPDLAQYQIDALFCPERFAFVEATTKAGKTAGCIAWILWQLHEAPPNSVLRWIAPVYKQAQIAYDRIRNILRVGAPPEADWEAKKHDMEIVIESRRIQFKGGDDPDGLFGEDVFAAVIDEASRCKDGVWVAVRSTLTATNGPARLIGNVKGRKNWAYKLGQQAKSGMPGWKYSKITALDAIDAGIISKEEVEAARAELPEIVFRELYLAEPADDGANPFGIEHIAACVKPISDKAPVVFGVDVARKQDWTVVYGLDEDGTVCRFERFHGVPWQECIERIANTIGNVKTFVDATGVGDAVVDALHRRVSSVEGFLFTSKSKQQLMEGLAIAIQRHEIGYPAGVTVDELEAFEFEYKSHGVSYSAPEGMHDDCVCALALAVKGKQAPQWDIGIHVVSRDPHRQQQVSHEEGIKRDEAARQERFKAFLAGATQKGRR